MGQHRSTFVRNIEKVAVAFLTLFVLKRRIGFIAILLMIVSVLGEMNDNVFNAMERLGVEEVQRIVRGRQVTVRAVGYKTLGVVDVGGGLPCVVGILDLMAPRAKLRRACAHHCVVTEAEKGESDEEPYGDEDGRFDQFFHIPLLVSRVMVRKQPHRPLQIRPMESALVRVVGSPFLQLGSVVPKTDRGSNHPNMVIHIFFIGNVFNDTLYSFSQYKAIRKLFSDWYENILQR
jgi:hypothetical protein